MSRWGGFKKRLFKRWNEIKSPSSVVDETPVIQRFDYTQAQGIWNLRSTTQFSKKSYGLSNSLDSVTGENNAWSQRTVDITPYAHAKVRLVFKYTNGSSFTGDLQLDAVDLDGAFYSFEGTSDNFQTSTAGETTYDGVNWVVVTPGTTTTARWNSDVFGTPSGNTGRTDAASGSYYIYSETSAPANVTGYHFWLRSPVVTLSSSPTLSYYEARLGAGIGTLNVYLDVIS